MICPICKTTSSNENNFCVKCGATLGAKTESLPNKFQSIGNIPETTLALPWFSGVSETLNGRTLDGKYQLEAKLGTGGVGAVYLATRLHIGDKVAVKVLRSDKNNDLQTTERFRLEAQMAAHLKHPNAVVIYDYGVTSDSLRYLVMEFIEGRTLRQLISQQGALPVSLIAEINSQVCAALDEAHRIGLIHRDIKPDNIIVQETPAGLRVKVLDFGIAKLSSLGASNLTQTGTIVGTPRYMSPEQCMGEQLDGRSDIYSLGIVLYEMMCGIVPFNAPSSTAVAVQQVTHPPPPLCQINQNISPMVEAVVLRTLEKKREARQPTAAELAKELNAAVNNQPQFTQPGIALNFGATPTNELIQKVSTSGHEPPTVSLPSFSGDKQFTPAGLAAVGQKSERKKSNLLLLITALVLSFFLFGGIGATGMWLWLRQPTDVVTNYQNKTSNNNPANNQNSTDNSSKNINSSPSGNPADDELTRLRNERTKVKAGQINKIVEELEEAEKKYPKDYRFPYERALLLAKSPGHHEAFHALSEAAATAIKNNQSPQMLSDLMQKKDTDFRRLKDHKEWMAIENALNQKNESLLPKDED